MRPRLLVPVLLCLAALVAVVPTSAQDEPPLAVLMSLSGEVTVTAADGSTRPGAFGMHLQPGDAVDTGTGASAEILFSTGNWVQVGPNSRTAVGPPRNAAPPSEDFASVQDFLRLKDSRGTSSMTGLRSGAGPDRLRLVEPCQSRVRADDLRFVWAGEEAAAPVKVVLYGEDQVVWETEVDGATEIAYPDGAPALDPQVSYSWSVESADPLVIPPLRSETGSFEVLPPAEAAGLEEELARLEGEGDSAGRHLVKASLLYRHGLLDDAVAETRAALDADPDNPQLRSLLARLLGEAGRNAEAAAEFDRALSPR
jgi:hypothetical protein